MIKIAISQAAFEAIAKTLPLGSVGYENAGQQKGRAADLAGQSGCRPPAPSARPGERYSDVILRSAAAG